MSRFVRSLGFFGNDWVTMARRCFILGAGFSKCCGLPLAGELAPIVWRAVARRHPMDRSPDAALVAPDDVEYPALATGLEAIKLLFPDRACDPDRADTWPDFEELITALDETRRYQESFERIRGTKVHNWAAEPKRRLMRGLQERLSELTDAAGDSGLEPIARFLQSLDLGTDCVISFNWDVLLEIAADELGLAVHYRDGQAVGLRLAKPHGSLNLVDSLAAEYEKARESINVHRLDTELEYDDGEPRIVLRARNPRHSWVRQEWARERLLVEPNLRKAYDRLWLELQWTRALDMVRRADELIVIGFSLPVADLRPRILFQLSRLNRAPAPGLTIVDPNATALVDHYRRLTGFEPAPLDGTLESWLTSRT
jgi:hypothetical protein